MSLAIGITVLSTTTGFFVGGAAGFICCPCGPCAALFTAPAGGAIGFALPIIAFVGLGIAESIASALGRSFEGGSNLLSSVVMFPINHPVITLTSWLALFILGTVLIKSRCRYRRLNNLD